MIPTAEAIIDERALFAEPVKVASQRRTFVTILTSNTP
jgi:hypothetical protein